MARLKIRGTPFVWFGICLALSSCVQPNGHLTITNDADSVVNHLQLDVCGQRFVFENVPAGDAREVKYKVSCDSHYDVVAIFPDGKDLRQQLGYVTPGLAANHRISLRRAGAVLQVSEKSTDVGTGPDRAMHDWTLLDVNVDWKQGTAVMKFRNLSAHEVDVTATGLVDLQLPRAALAGKSALVDEAHGPISVEKGPQKISIEMQSGDTIELTATSIVLP